MLEVADILRLHGPAYRAKFSARMLPSHRPAMQDIETCRTEALGGWAAHTALATRSQRSRPMKLRLSAFVVVTIVPPTVANNSRRHRRTLSATAKKTSLGGWLLLPPTLHLWPHASFSSRRSPSIHASSPQLLYSNSKWPLTRLSPTQNCVAASSSHALPLPPRPTLILNTLCVVHLHTVTVIAVPSPSPGSNSRE